jgi:hypothetical protein
MPLDQISVDTTTLDASGILRSHANICITLIRRTTEQFYYKYMCGGGDESLGFESWSSSKVVAMANAAGHLREECARGMDSTTEGKHGTTPLGDLATVICSYDTTQGYSSNSLSSYFHDIGWRERAHDLVVGSWLNRPDESLGGNYGEATPSDLAFDFSNEEDTCPADKDPWLHKYPNTYSAMSAAELVRRIALHRDIPDDMKFPGATWTDMQTIMYGAEESALFPGLAWGGMSADIAVFIQNSVDIEAVDKDSAGQWRIFSKLGAGYSTDRDVGEVVNNGYACFPVLDENGAPVPDAGLEFVISARGSVPYDYGLTKAERSVLQAMQEVIGAAVDGAI